LPLSSILNIELNNNLTTKNIQIPIEVIDDTGKINKLILNSSQIITKLPIIVSAFLVAKPSSFARFLYNVCLFLFLKKNQAKFFSHWRGNYLGDTPPLMNFSAPKV